MSNENLTRSAAQSARWMPYRINPMQGRMQLVQMTRACYTNSNFLDDRFVPGDDQQVVSLPEVSGNHNRPAIDFLFHGAFCGSTLLSRCLDIPGSRLAIREPLILRQLFEIQRLHGERFGPDEMTRLLKLAMLYLGKGFSTGEKVLIKPSNLCNAFIESLLQLTRGRAILLSVGLEDFLVSAIKKGPESLAKFNWVLAGMITPQTLKRLPRRISARIERATHLEAAAIVWLLQSWQFEDLLKGRFGNRLKAAHFERFLARPNASLSEIITFLEPRAAHRRVDIKPLQYNAKQTNSRYGPRQRQLEARYIRKDWGRQIDALLHWIAPAQSPGNRAGDQSPGFQPSARAS